MTNGRVRSREVSARWRASPLLRAKVRPPVQPEHYVRRPRLLELLDDAVRAAVTLVVGPPGAGKTVLLAGWAAESSGPTAWLSLDEVDADGTELWAGLLAALEALVPDRVFDARTALQRQGGLTDVVSQLLNDLDLDAPSAVLVIDDVHLLDENPPLVQSLSRFVQHLPAWLHVVLLSRRSPSLPIDRMRARGMLSEVHFAELRFSHDEATELLSQLSPALTPDEVEVAAERVAGWAAGLQMSALAARAARAQSAHAPSVDSDLLIDDYVWHEVLGDEDPDVVDVMMRTAIVERVSASLAEALTGRPDAGELLRRADARGLFVTRVGTDGWFIVHSLVRAALLAELARRPHDQLVAQHARAARWFEDAGEFAAALDHWLQAERPRDALRLLAATHPQLYDTGREATTRRVIAAIPAHVAGADFAALLEYAWCHVLVDRRRFTAVVEQARWWADHNEVSARLHARLTLLRSIAATINGSWVEGGELARRALREFGGQWWNDPLGRFCWNMIAREVALGESWRPERPDVRDAVLALSRDPERGLALQGTQALGEALAGRPVDALRVAAGVRHAAAVTNMTILRGELAVAEAVAHRELGDHALAVAELIELAAAPAETMLYCRVLAMLELTQAHLELGDLDAARAAFLHAQELVDAERFGPDGDGWLARIGTQLALRAGALDEAKAWAERIPDPFWYAVSHARIHLAAGDRASAIDALDGATAALRPPRCGAPPGPRPCARGSGRQGRRGGAGRRARVAQRHHADRRRRGPGDLCARRARGVARAGRVAGPPAPGCRRRAPRR